MLEIIKYWWILFPGFFGLETLRDEWITKHRFLQVQNVYCGVALLTMRDMVYG